MILLGGQIEGINSRKDKTIKLTIGTQEMTPAQCGQIFELHQSFCYIGLKKEPFTKDESDVLESLKTDFANAKTPSQRLRGILYLNFQNNPEGYIDFNSYYLAKMELICEHYKSKLD
jgi:hypothetical protein